MTSTSAPRTATPDDVATPESDAVRTLLDQDQYWVPPLDWNTFVRTADRALLVPTRDFTRDRCIAVRAWLYQQRHGLYRALGLGTSAPEGWIESTRIHAFVAARTRSRQAARA